MSNSYETIIVYSLAKGEEAAKELHAKFEAMMAANGTVDSVDEWGKRKLAYLINDEDNGYFFITTLVMLISPLSSAVFSKSQMVFFVLWLLKNKRCERCLIVQL